VPGKRRSTFQGVERLLRRRLVAPDAADAVIIGKRNQVIGIGHPCGGMQGNKAVGGVDGVIVTGAQVKL
jgi:hypothetical protein